MTKMTPVIRAAALVAIGAATIAATPRPLELRDLRAAVAVTSPQISPDGTRIAAILRRGDYEKNRYVNELVLVNVRTHARTVLTRGRDSVGSERWSPDGAKLAFIALTSDPDDKKSKPARQIFTIAFDGSEPLQVTHAPNGVGDYAWRPDGKSIAYTIKDDAPNKKAIDAHEDAFEVDDSAWTEDSATPPTHVWLTSVTGGKAVRLTSGAWTVVGGLGFSKDGRTLFFARQPKSTNHYRSTTVAAIDLATKRIRFVAPVGRRAFEATVSPDGMHLAFEVERPGTPSQSDIGLTDLNGADFRDLTTKLDRNVQSLAFTGGGEVLIASANDGTRHRLYRITTAGVATALALGDLNESGAPSVARTGAIAFVATDDMHAGELYVLAPGGHPVRLTDINRGIDAHILAPTTTIAWRSRDGFMADGVLTPPVGFVRGKKFPLVLVIHGGPTDTSTTSYSSLVQLLAARGYFVFQPNYRGSDNLGHTWAQATVPHITSAPAQDCEEGLAAVLKRKTGEIDTARIGVSGWSEGGLMTSWLIGHDTRWKAAVSGAAVDDWIGYHDLTDAQDFTPIFIGPSPWTDPKLAALYEAESPLTYADRVKTHTLFITDSGDYRVPTPLDYEFYHAIRATGTPVEMKVYPRLGHFPSDPVGQESVFRTWVGWFARNL